MSYQHSIIPYQQSIYLLIHTIVFPKYSNINFESTLSAKSKMAYMPIVLHVSATVISLSVLNKRCVRYVRSSTLDHVMMSRCGNVYIFEFT